MIKFQVPFIRIFTEDKLFICLVLYILTLENTKIILNLSNMMTQALLF